jgi:phosphate acyltransferase
MGGDRAPTETVAGAVLAAEDGVDVVLVGDRERLDAELAALGARLPVVHAPAVIEMGDDPARAIREKPDSSIVACARMLRNGEASAVVSAGSTGAVMASAAILVGRIPGVLRPTIATIFPTPGSSTLVLDSGANPEVKPEHLVQFAVMGAVAARLLLGIDDPRVGLLNIGEEPSKGRALERATHRLLTEAPIRFVGNVEGRDLGADRADVFVTDGFTGNVVLKTTEGIAQMVGGMLLEAMSGLEPEVLQAVLPVLADVRRRGDYENTGGAHLLGVNGVVIIAHGSSGRVAVSNAIHMAHAAADRNLPARLAEHIAGV